MKLSLVERELLKDELDEIAAEELPDTKERVLIIIARVLLHLATTLS